MTSLPTDHLLPFDLSLRQRLRRVAAAGALLLCAALPSAVHTAQPWWLHAPATPERLAPGVLSTDAEESALNLSPDGRVLLFARSRIWFPASRIATVMQAERTASGWTEPVPAAFSRGFSDIDPFIGRDGERVFFSSMRPVDGRPRKDFDLWMLRWQDGAARPENLGPQVNSDADDLYPSVDRDGTLYFGSERSGGQGGWDLYRARRLPDGRYGPAENLGPPLNTGAWEYNPAVAPDGSFLIFASLERPGGQGAGDLWIARRGADGRFGTPQPLGGGVNTPADDYHPSLSPDARTLFFVRRDPARGQGADFYWVSLDAVLAATR